MALQPELSNSNRMMIKMLSVQETKTKMNIEWFRTANKYVEHADDVGFFKEYDFVADSFSIKKLVGNPDRTVP